MAAALAVLLPLGGPAEAILVASPNIPPSDTTLLVQRDSAQYTFAGQAGTVSDASSAPVDVSISFP